MVEVEQNATRQESLKPLYASTRRARKNPPFKSTLISIATDSTLQSPRSICLLAHNTEMSSTPSSRRRGHSSRNSQSSSPAQPPQATPKSSRQTANAAAVASSSPLFFQSSPARSGRAGPSHLPSDGMIISSPPRNSSNAGDRETTPRPSNRPAQGMPSPHSIRTIVLTPSRIVSCSL